MNKLYPCPFCGHKPYQGSLGNGQFTIKCYNCSITMTHDRIDKIIGIWNNRPIQNQLIKACEKALTTGGIKFESSHLDSSVKKFIMQAIDVATLKS